MTYLPITLEIKINKKKIIDKLNIDIKDCYKFLISKSYLVCFNITKIIYIIFMDFNTPIIGILILFANSIKHTKSIKILTTQNILFFFQFTMI